MNACVMKTENEVTKCYILQQYDTTKGCVNIFYMEDNGEDHVWLGKPEKATRYNTIGEAMKAAVEVQKRTGILLKAVEYYTVVDVVWDVKQN